LANHDERSANTQKVKIKRRALYHWLPANLRAVVARRRLTFEFSAAALVLAGACTQSRVLGLPLPTILLGIGLAILISLRDWPWPALAFPWWQSVFLALLCVGLLGMSRTQFPSAVKELVQAGEIFVASWYLMRLVTSKTRRRLIDILAGVCLLLLLLGTWNLYRVPPLALSDTRYAVFVVVTFPFVLAAIRRLETPLQTAVILTSGVLVGYTFRHGGLIVAWIIAVAVYIVLNDRRLWRWAVPSMAAAVLLSLAPHGPAASPWDMLNPRYDEDSLKRLYIEYQASPLAPVHYPFGGGLGCYKNTINELKLYRRNEPDPEDMTIPRDANNQYLLTMVESGIPAAAALVMLLIAAVWAAAQYRPHPRSTDRAEADALIAALVALAVAGLFSVILSRGIGILAGCLFGWASSRELLRPARRWPLRLAVPAAAMTIALTVMLLVNVSADPVTGQSRANRWVRSGIARLFTSPGERLRIVTIEDNDTGGRQIKVEAEDCSALDGAFLRVEANDASGNRVLDIPEDSGKGRGTAVYDVDIPESGRYALSARVYWLDGCSNSIGFTVDNDNLMITSDLFCQWHDVTARRTVDLKTGRTRVIIRNLEDGVCVDYWVLRRKE